jgi:hypothetical protein
VQVPGLAVGSGPAAANIAQNQQNVPVDERVPLWHHPAMMSGTRNQFSLTRAASSKWRRVNGKSLSVYQFSKTMRLLTVPFVVLTLPALTARPAPAADEGTPPSGALLVYTKDNAPATPKLDALPLKESVSDYGITWTFEKPARAGQFINGDWYVVGPVTVVKIDPAPRYGNEVADDELDGREKVPVDQRCRNGSMLNMPARQEVAWDSGVLNYYHPEHRARLPIAMNPGDSLASSISLRQGEKVTYPYHPGTVRGEGDNSPVKTVAVLTCVAGPWPPDAFRPGYCGHDPRIYLARDLQRHLLPRFDRPAGAPDPAKFAENFQRPWCDTGFFSFDVPQQSMPNYAQWYAQGPANAVLLACCDGTQALVLRAMKLEKPWNHDAFLDYVDRWMFEDDKPFRIEIAKYCRPPL